MSLRLHGNLLVALALWLTLSAASAPVATAQTIVTELVALEGQTAPDTSGGLFESFGPPSVSCMTAFQATFARSGGGTGSGIFMWDGTLEAIALDQTLAPDTGGGLFAGFFDPVVNSFCDVAFVATVIGGTVGQGVFLYSNANDTVSALAVTFETAIDSGGGFIAGFQPSVGLTDTGEAHVITSVGSGSFSSGVYAYSLAGSRLVLRDGQAAPAPLVGTYLTPGVPGVSSNGWVTMSVLLQIPAPTSAIVRVDPLGNDSLVALAGSLAPGSMGGTFSGFAGGPPSVSSVGDVSFHGFVGGGAFANALFHFDDPTTSVVMEPGQTAPDTGGGTFGQPFEHPTGNDEAVGFRNDLAGAGAGEGLFLSRGPLLESIAVSGDPAPDLPGAFFDEFPDPPALGASTSNGFLRAYRATTTGAVTAEGIWEAPEPGFASMLVIGTLVLALRGCDRSRRRAR